MARMSKRISNKIHKAKEEQQPQEKKKYGKDIWLIILIELNIFLINKKSLDIKISRL